MEDVDAVAIIIRNEAGQYRMGIRAVWPNAGTYIPAMGRVRVGRETPEQTAVREAYEEVGLAGDEPYSSRVRRWGKVTDRRYSCRIGVFEILPPHVFGEATSDELTDVGFYDYGKIRDRCPPVIKAAIDALECGETDFSLEVE